MTRLIVVCGPTGTGKSKLAVRLAGQFGGEVVSADSMQVYRGLVVGTAAPTAQEQQGVAHHLIGCCPPQQPYSVADWMQDAHRVIQDVENRGRLPILCGGTGLYIQSLISGVDYTHTPADPALRGRLYEEWEKLGGEAMLLRLRQRDMEHAEKLHVNDKKRILRSLEQNMVTGYTARQRAERSRDEKSRYAALCLGLDYSERSQLYEATDARVDGMLRQGLLKEARQVWEHRDSYKTAAQAIGYKEFFPFFEGDEMELEACALRLKQATRNYAKRQLTWFRRMPDIHWLQADAPALWQEAWALVQNWLAQNIAEAGREVQQGVQEEPAK